MLLSGATWQVPKVSVLQANAKLVQCSTWNQRSRDSVLTGVIFCYWNILFSCNKASDANIGIIAILVHFEKLKYLKVSDSQAVSQTSYFLTITQGWEGWH